MIEITPNKTIHFIGIGGSGMSPIAKILLEKSFKVTGSDIKESVNTIRLKDAGAKIFYGHGESNLREADIVVVSSAIAENNEEYQHALGLNLPILRRAEMLNFLMNACIKRIAVCGTHGKTTTTSMLTQVLGKLNQQPTYIIGGELKDFGGNAGLGNGNYFVAEADESDGSFLMLNANIGILTNIEAEHMNYFKTFDNLMDHFKKLLTGITQKGGYVVLNRDDDNINQIAKTLLASQIVSYSVDTASEIMATDLTFSPSGTAYTLILNGKPWGTVKLSVFGRHHVYNSLATIAFAVKEQLDLEAAVKSLQNFSGAKRRFQLIGEVKGIRIYDDYGHHPTEIKTTLLGAKNCLNGRLIGIFQPHRYSRTMDFLDDFAASFDAADKVIITDIYAANEQKIDGISGNTIIEKMKASGRNHGEFIALKSHIPDKLIAELSDGDIVVTIGAGDIYTVAKELVTRLKQKEQIHP